ncbi:MAG: BON domain-containing protein, partial [Gemmataceae bacterium]|nr:BON domain-containing protein [Gemmataceae bacterium]
MTKRIAFLLVRSIRHPRTALAIALCTVSLAVAAAPADSQSLRDSRLAARARRALNEDPVLATLNVGVSVRSGVAQLWGPVPTPSLVRRAEDIVRRVPGVVAVQSELHIEVRDDLLNEVVQNHPWQALPPELRPRPSRLTSRWADTEAT